MSTSNLNDLYDNLYMLLLSLNKEFFNHNVIMKKIYTSTFTYKGFILFNSSWSYIYF